MTILRGKLKIVLSCTIFLFVFAINAYGKSEESQRTEVIVLSTLHQMHAEVDGYSFEDLSYLVEQLNPDVLAVELTAIDLESRRDQTIKQEYQESIFPLLDKHDVVAVPLEPPQPLYDEIVNLIRTAQSGLSKSNPERAKAFGVYTDSLYEMLREMWTSPEAVNSVETDRLFDSKHRFQGAVFGPMEVEGWQRWNQHFLNQIHGAVSTNPGARIVVLVGAEHSYWLRAHLQSYNYLLPDTAALIREIRQSD